MHLFYYSRYIQYTNITYIYSIHLRQWITLYIYFFFAPVLLIVLQFNNNTIIILSRCFRTNYIVRPNHVIETKIKINISLFADARIIWPRKYNIIVLDS